MCPDAGKLVVRLQRFMRQISFLLALSCAAAAAAQQPAAPEPAQVDVNLARKGLANTARLSCLIEYDEPNRNAELMSIGWDAGSFCDCVDVKVIATMSDDVAREAALWLLRTQNTLKTPADLARLSTQPQVAEYLRLTKNAKGNCIYQKMRR
jgi:hypothetical protein